MSEPIKAGDLVMLIRPTICCGYDGGHLGRIYVAVKVEYVSFRCSICRKPVSGHRVRSPTGCGYLSDRLKRIDPLPESERTETNERIPA